MTTNHSPVSIPAGSFNAETLHKELNAAVKEADPAKYSSAVSIGLRKAEMKPSPVADVEAEEPVKLEK